MKQVAEEKDLFKACRIIFGPDLTYSRDFLEYIQIPGVKNAFRKRAMESHPDRMRLRTEEESGQPPEYHFRVVKEAYDTLYAYLIARDRGYCLPKKPRHSSTSCRKEAGHNRAGENHGQGVYNRQQTGKSAVNRKARFSCAGRNKEKDSTTCHRGKYSNRRAYQKRERVPQRRLLFGHYLYYMGVIDWPSLVKALIWQRQQRYRIGELARKKGWLTHLDIQNLLKDRKSDHTFGQKALARGLLTEKQVAYLLCQQKKKQKKIGEYFLEKDIVSRKQLAELLLSFNRHNTLYRRRSSLKLTKNSTA